jgi:hypothetical protein
MRCCAPSSRRAHEIHRRRIHALLQTRGMNEPLRIRYRFDLPDGSQKTLDFSFDAATFKLQNPPPADPPFWTELKFNRCSNCPLKEQEHPHCPAALQMASALEPLKALVSFDTVGVTVLQPERKVYAETTVQQAMSSVFGLIMATAGCPWTDRLRPMARFHLPFAARRRRCIAASRCIFCRGSSCRRSAARMPADSRRSRTCTRICMW